MKAEEPMTSWGFDSPHSSQRLLLPLSELFSELREDYILRVLADSPTALTLDEIHSHVSPVLSTPRKKLRSILSEMNHQGKLKKETYTVVFSKKPLIKSVVSKIYFVDGKQKVQYEEKVLPKLRQETLDTIR